MIRLHALVRCALLAGAALAALPAHAQRLDYESTDGAAATDKGGHTSRGAGSGARTTIRPYIEATQNVLFELSPGDEVLTYSTIAAGVDMALNGRRTQGAVSLRYERRIAESGNMRDGDTVSGIARVKHDLIPRTLSVEAGALAARTRVEAGGASTLGALAVTDAVSQVYSLYAGPALSTHVGDVALAGSYMVGYTRVEAPKSVQLGAGQPLTDVFDHSVAQSAQVSAGIAPGTVLPVGVTASAGINQEDISNLDQRVRDMRAGVQVVLPVNMELALVGSVGYEDVEVAARDAVRDGNGLPVIGSDGRYVTDSSQSRRLAYDVSGFTWDAGVMWRPSRRTSLSAFVGHRYDSLSYYGSFSYAPNARSSLTIGVFDSVSGFGSQMGTALRGLPTDFEVSRNPFGGGISGCAIGGTSGGCVDNALSSVSSSVFRARGINATYGQRIGRMQAGIGAGYVRRKYIAAPGTVLAAANGTVDESAFVSGNLSGPIDRRSSFALSTYAAWYRSGQTSAGDVTALGTTAAYFRNLTDRLVASAAVGLETVNREVLEDEVIAQGLVGLRYNF